MKITYISHASLLIEVNGIKILTDPWIAGPAYCEQWYVFPPPIDGYNELLHDIDFVLLSHGHEDHTHHETLKLINKSAQIFYRTFAFSQKKSPIMDAGRSSLI